MRAPRVKQNGRDAALRRPRSAQRADPTAAHRDFAVSIISPICENLRLRRS